LNTTAIIDVHESVLNISKYELVLDTFRYF